MEQLSTIVKELGAEFVATLVAAALGFIGLQIQRYSDLFSLNNAVKRASGLAMSAMSTETTGEVVDEQAAVSIADDYLRDNVPNAAKRLGANLGSIAMAAVVGEIARATRK